jgi:hypothetical protein
MKNEPHFQALIHIFVKKPRYEEIECTNEDRRITGSRCSIIRKDFQHFSYVSI